MLGSDGRAVLVSVVVAAFCAAIAHALTCNEQHACLKAGTCRMTANATSLGCSFRTTVGPAAARLLNVSGGRDGTGMGTRGVCAPGMVQSVSVHTDQTLCVRHRTFPDALNGEIQLAPAAEQASEASEPAHRRWCGAWMDAQPTLLEETKWAFFDADAVTADVDAVVGARGSSRVAGQDVAKFRSACRAMLGNSALGIAATQAYEHLLGALALDNLVTTDREQVLRAAGALAAYACDGPASVGLTVAGATFAVHVGTGVAVDGAALSDALYAVGASRTTRSEARAFADEMEDAVDNGDPSGAFAISEADADAVVRGADPSTAAARLAYASVNPALGAFAHVAGQAPAEVAHSYLRGLAAYCAHAVRTVVAGEQGGLVATAVRTVAGTSVSMASAVRRRNDATPRELRPRSLGRLDGRPGVVIDAFSHLNETHLHAATSATWSALPPVFDGGESAGDRSSSIKEQCLAAARLVYPDAFDRLAFDTLVSSRLYERLRPMSEALRAAVVEAVGRDEFARTHTEAGRMLMLHNAKRATLRIAGAPRGSWGGRSAAFVPPSLASTDSALTIMLKQAKALFLDRVGLARRADSVCEHPSFFDARVRNAYLFFSSKFACAVVMPGMLVPPFADERYDDESLYARIGYVVAHEFAHVSSITQLWDHDAVETMLVHDYARSAWPEALADRIGVWAVVRTGNVPPARLCAHVSQLWCARIGTLVDRTAEGQSHPLSNARGDALCTYLNTLSR